MRGEGLHFVGLAENEKSQTDFLGPVVFGMFRCVEIRSFCLGHDILVARLDDYYDF